MFATLIFWLCDRGQLQNSCQSVHPRVELSELQARNILEFGLEFAVHWDLGICPKAHFLVKSRAYFLFTNTIFIMNKYFD